MRVASRALRFTIPVPVVVGLGADVVVISIISMVMGIDIVVGGIDVLAVGDVVVVNDGRVGCIMPFAGAMFFREISPLGVCSCTMMC